MPQGLCVAHHTDSWDGGSPAHAPIVLQRTAGRRQGENFGG